MTLLIMNLYQGAVTNGKCPNGDQYCLNCTNTSCALCGLSYVDSNGQCQPPTTEISNCATYENASVCKECKYGYHLSSNTCKAITVDNCLFVSTLNTAICLVCNNGKQSDPSTGKCTDTECGISNCTYCMVMAVGTSNSVQCVECKSGYSLNSQGACVTEVTANCDTQSSTDCVQCKVGYYDSGSTCTVSELQKGLNIQLVFALI